MPEPHRLVFVGAHPDDETFGMGGTLAKHAAAGALVYYVCGTRGEVGAADPEHLQGYASPADMRSAELACAARELGLTGVIHLGYRDSGMPGSVDNEHPAALAAAPVEELTGRIAKALRDMRPQVVVTFDPIGGYYHPDHIAIHRATVRAFNAAADPSQYPEAGAAYRPQKLYCQVFPRGMLRLAVRALRLIGRDPRRYGRNGDIDLVTLSEVEFPVHLSVAVRGEAARRRAAATACHKSQLDAGPAGRGIAGLVERILLQTENFMRVYPPTENGRPRERDLFEGVI